MILMFDGSIHDGGGNVHGFPGIFSPGEEKNPAGAEALGGMGDQSKKRQPLVVVMSAKLAPSPRVRWPFFPVKG